MNIRSQLIRLASAGCLALLFAAAGFTKPADAATLDVSGFALDGTPTLVTTLVGSSPALLSLQFLPQTVPSEPDGGFYGTISVDVGAPIVTFVADGLPFVDPTNLEVGLFPGSGIFSFLLPANYNVDLTVTATGDLIFANFLPGGPILRITTTDVLNQTPLPGALPLLASGLAGLGLVHWRRRRRQAQAA